jgi:uncharacterized protein YnzC (UPF0291/DUF896 family)
MSNASEHDMVVKRINLLAHKAKTVGLSEDELEERDTLRKRYIQAFKNSLRSQLDNITIVDDSDKH